MRFFSTLVFIILLSVASFGQTNWASYGKDSYNSSNAQSSIFSYPIGVKDSISNNINPNDGLGRAIVVGDTLIYTSDNRIWARDIETSQVYWMNTYINSKELSSPCYAYGNVYIQVGDHSSSKLVCLTLDSGLTLWSTGYSVQWPDLTAPIVSDSNVIIVEGYYSTTIASYDAFSGNKNWSTDISSNNFDDWNPAIFDGKVYGFSDKFGVLDIETGSILKSIGKDSLFYSWAGWSVEGSPVIDTLNNQIILTNRYAMFALDLDSYSVNWNISSQDYGLFKNTPALSGNSLYIGTTARIMEISASDGQLNWSNTNYTATFDPVVSDSVVVFSSNDSIVVVDKKTYQIGGRYPVGGNLTLSEDYLIITEYKGNIVHLLERKLGGLTTSETAEIDQYKITLYPTISNGTFKLQCSPEWIGSDYYLCSATGEIVKNGKIKNAEILFFDSLTSGMYIMTVVNSTNRKSMKLIVE